ncbi:MAG: hypothetical protein VX484_05400, partial [Chloroflexota bacterium]|nr:hypothetical protein [Chloroflexota bacterium]
TLDAGQPADFTDEATFGGTLPLVFNYSGLDQMPRCTLSGGSHLSNHLRMRTSTKNQLVYLGD